MQQLKIATVEDMPAILRMSRSFHEASPYKHLGYDESYAYRRAEECLRDQSRYVIILSLSGDDPVGILAAASYPLMFNGCLGTTELMFWVDEEHRSGKHGKELKRAYEYWAKNVIGAQIACMGALEDERLSTMSRVYRRQGYQPAEHQFFKEL